MRKRADGQGEGEERRVSRQWSKNTSGNRRNVQVSETERMPESESESVSEGCVRRGNGGRA